MVGMIQKDVECTFGILKGRFIILKAEIRLHGVDIADDIRMTCCAMHNILLENDGLIDEWDGKLGLFDLEDKYMLPFVIQYLQNPSELRHYDSSRIGPGFHNGTNSDTIPLPSNILPAHIVLPPLELSPCNEVLSRNVVDPNQSRNVVDIN